MTELEIPEGAVEHVKEAIFRLWEKWKLGELPYKPGDFIGQRYQVYGVFEPGYFGVVYLSYHLEVKEVLALKTFHDKYLEDAEIIKRFHEEANAWARLECHPYLVRAYIDEVSGRLYIAMEYIAPDEQGLNTLQSYLNDPYNRPDLAQSLKWAIQFCHGMEYAYSKGIKCHGDIKPDNIMISYDKTVKISDFGLAKVTGERDVFRYKGAIGYVAPEGGVNERSDIYSFGIVLWQMAAGSAGPPSRGLFGGIPSVNGPMQAVIESCLQNNPKYRYQTFKELRGELEILFKKETGEVIEPPDKIPPEAWELGNKGVNFCLLGRFNEAISCLNEAIKINLKNTEAYTCRGNAYYKKGQYDLAIADYNRALEINPRLAGAYTGRGNAYDKQGQYDLAIADHTRALKINPRDADAYYNRGNAYADKGQYDRAIAEYNRALEINPRLALAYYNRGNAYGKQGQYDFAITDYTKAIEINPRYAEAYYNRAVAYYSKEAYDKAWEDVHKAQGLGCQVNPRLLELLRQASGRQR